MPSLDLLTSVPPVGLAIAVTALYFVTHPDTAQKWNGILGSAFAWASVRFERRAVAGTITSEIDSFAKALNKLIPDSLPFGIHIKWVTKKDEAFLEKDQVVVLMRQHTDNAQNLAVACMLYMSQGLLPSQRLYVDDEVMEVLQIAVAQKALISRNRPDALKYFNTKIVAPLVERNPNLEGLFTVVKSLEPTGTLMTVLIPEIAGLSSRLEDVVPPDATKEVRKFIAFLDERVRSVANHEDSPMDFEGKCFRVGIVYVGMAEKILTRYVDPYVKAISYSVDRAIQRVYLMAIGKVNVFVARQVGTEAAKAGLGRVKCESGFKVIGSRGKALDGITVRFETFSKS